MVAGLTALGLVAASYRLATKSLWLDEAVSADHARLGLVGLGKVIAGGDPNMGLYWVLLHAWTRIFGYTEVALRSLTVLLGASAIPVIVILGTRLFGRAAGLVAGLLLALSPFFVHYEQTARSYALVVLLVTLSSYFFVCELERPSPPTRAGYVLASALAVYAHYFAAYALLVQLLTLLAVKRRAALAREWLRVLAAIALLCAPEAIFAARKGSGGIHWIHSPSLSSLVNFPSVLAGGILLACVLLLLAAYCLLVDRRGWRAPFVAAWLVVPVLADFAISKLGRPLFVSYYLIVVLPALFLLAAGGLVKLPGRLAAIAVLGLLLVLSAVGISNWFSRPSQEDYRGATRYLLGHERGTDGVVYYPSYTRYGFALYEALAHERGPAVIPFALGQPLSTRPPRIWLAMRKSDVQPERQSQIERSLLGHSERLVMRRGFRNIEVILYRTQ